MLVLNCASLMLVRSDFNGPPDLTPSSGRLGQVGVVETEWAFDEFRSAEAAASVGGAFVAINIRSCCHAHNDALRGIDVRI